MGDAASTEGCICVGSASLSTPRFFLLRILPKTSRPAVKELAVNTKPFYLQAAAILPVQLKKSSGFMGVKPFFAPHAR